MSNNAGTTNAMIGPVLLVLSLHFMFMAVGLHYSNADLMLNMLVSIFSLMMASAFFKGAQDTTGGKTLTVHMSLGLISSGVSIYYISASFFAVNTFAKTGAWQ